MVVEAEKGDMLITAINKVKGMIKPNEVFLVLRFNDITIKVYPDSNNSDLATIYFLKQKIRIMKQN